MQEDIETTSEPSEGASEEEEKEEIAWPYTKGTGRRSLRFFDIVDMPDYLDEETTPEGRFIMGLISEILYLKGSLAVIVKERKQASFEEWLKTQGKDLRDPGKPQDILDMMKPRKK